jgi:hypothetical protein
VSSPATNYWAQTMSDHLATRVFYFCLHHRARIAGACLLTLVFVGVVYYSVDTVIRQRRVASNIEHVSSNMPRQQVITMLGQPGNCAKLKKGRFIPGLSLREMDIACEDCWTDGTHVYLIRYYSQAGELVVVSVHELLPCTRTPNWWPLQ